MLTANTSNPNGFETRTVGRVMVVRLCHHYPFCVVAHIGVSSSLFSGGLRGCIDSRFSRTESLCFIARLVRQFEILLPKGMAEMTSEDWLRLLTEWTTGLPSAW